MSKIQLLDQNTINKIAAGEVVERPAAVVKELIENAIDAGANAVTCEIKEGGISFIRITDNGCGIDKEEIETAFLRHATSKIRTVEDLLSVSSLGFRGEALASIASVAQVELVTKTAKDMTGTRFVIEGGVKKGLDDIGCPNGTTFIVRNLFYNTPARRKFLKSPTTEASYVNDLMMRLSVSHPDVSFKFIVNNQIKLHTSGNNNLRDILYSIYGREIASCLLEVKAEISGVKIHGYVGKPIISRGNRTYENFYINGRYIKSSIICKAIEESFKPYVMQHKYPFTALHYEIASDLIDVNVHPTKLEVRFRNSEQIFRVTQEAISEALSTKDMIPEVSIDDTKEQVEKIKEAPEPFESRRLTRENSPFLLKPHQKNENSTSRIQNNGNPLNNKENEKICDTEIGKFQQVVNHAYELGQEKAKLQTESEKNNEAKQDETISIFEQLRKKREALLQEEQRKQEERSNEENEQKVDEQEINKTSVQPNAWQERNSPGTTISKTGEVVKEEPIYTSGKQINLFQPAKQDSDTDGYQAPFISEEARKKHHIIGQLFATYWIVEYEDKMFIIDQHAAHEKVLYEKTMKKIHEKEAMSQMIHPPIVLSLTMREEEVFLQHKEVFVKLGFEIENFGGKEYSIRAVPSDMLDIADETLLMDIIDQLVEDNYEKDSDLILEKVASMSCKAAIKGNHKMAVMEAEHLIDELLELENPFHCPHGRPVIISMSKYEIEKKFKRII